MGGDVEFLVDVCARNIIKVALRPPLGEFSSHYGYTVGYFRRIEYQASSPLLGKVPKETMEINAFKLSSCASKLCSSSPLSINSSYRISQSVSCTIPFKGGMM